MAGNGVPGTRSSGDTILIYGRQLTAGFDSQFSADGITRVGLDASYGPYPPDEILGGQKKNIGLGTSSAGGSMATQVRGGNRPTLAKLDFQRRDVSFRNRGFQNPSPPTCLRT